MLLFFSNNVYLLSKYTLIYDVFYAFLIYEELGLVKLEKVIKYKYLTFLTLRCIVYIFHLLVTYNNFHKC